MSITLFTGPMFSGKTSALISKYVDGGSTLAIKPRMDTRYSAEFITSHDGKRIPASLFSTYLPKENIAENVRIVLIDEGQFFFNLPEACRYYADELGLEVYVAALNGTSDMKPWPHVSHLIPVCDDIVHMKAKECSMCHQRSAPFTIYNVPGGKVGMVEIGGADKYSPVCRTCAQWVAQ